MCILVADHFIPAHVSETSTISGAQGNLSKQKTLSSGDIYGSIDKV